MNLKLSLVFMLCGALLSISHSANALDREKYKKHKLRQQQQIIRQARIAAEDWQFSKADDLLKRARILSASNPELKALEALIVDERAEQSAQRARQAEAERQRLAQQKKQQAEQKRAQAASSGSSSSSGACSTHVYFEFDGPGLDSSASIQLSGPSAVSVQGNGTSQVSADAYNGCIGGSYSFKYTNNASWSGGSDQRSYSGGFSVPDSAGYCSVVITDAFGVSANVNCSRQ